MTPLERLMAEDIPVRPAPPPPPGPWTPEQQAQHRAELLAALDGWTYDRDKHDGRHFRLIRQADAA